MRMQLCWIQKKNFINCDAYTCFTLVSNLCINFMSLIFLSKVPQSIIHVHACMQTCTMYKLSTTLFKPAYSYNSMVTTTSQQSCYNFTATLLQPCYNCVDNLVTTISQPCKQGCHNQVYACLFYMGKYMHWSYKISSLFLPTTSLFCNWCTLLPNVGSDLIRYAK